MKYVLLGCYSAAMLVSAIKAFRLRGPTRTGWIVATVAWGNACILQADLIKEML